MRAYVVGQFGGGGGVERETRALLETLNTEPDQHYVF
jgi:hypothetical protein